MDEETLLAMLRIMWDQRDPALNHIGSSYVSDVLRGKRSPGPKILTALGLRRVVTYEPVERDV